MGGVVQAGCCFSKSVSRKISLTVSHSVLKRMSQPCRYFGGGEISVWSEGQWLTWVRMEEWEEGGVIGCGKDFGFYSE